jgi:CBS domain-containing protein
MRVADRMRSVAVRLPPTASLADAEGTMTAHGVAWVPVVQNGRAVGLVGADDLAAARPSQSARSSIS